MALTQVAIGMTSMLAAVSVSVVSFAADSDFAVTTVNMELAFACQLEQV